MPSVSLWLTRVAGVTAMATTLVWAVSCGGDGRTELALSVGAAAAFQVEDGPPRTAGYQLAIVIEQVQSAARPTCPKLPTSLRLLVNDTDVAPAFDPSTGCLLTTATPGLYAKIGTVTVDVQDGDRVLGHAQFDGLTPGGDATLAVPADGTVHAGDEIVVVPAPTLSTASASGAFVYPLDDTTVSAKLIPPVPADRRGDGVHLVMPAFSGRAAITFIGMPYLTIPTYSCPGFDICTADADTTLGPVFVTEVP